MHLSPERELIFSPSDLTVFHQSRFASWLDRHYLELPSLAPDAVTPERAHAAARGEAHEQRVLQRFRDEGRQVTVIDRSARLFAPAHAATLAAVRAGHEVIYQAALSRGPLQGYADFLVRTERPSRTRSFSYEVLDTKLARRPKPAHLVQLLAYAHMLERPNGGHPDTIAVVDGDGGTHRFKSADLLPLFRALVDELFEFHARFHHTPRPFPEPRADHGRWSTLAAALLEDADHLSRVSGMTATQVKRLEAAGIPTLTALAETPPAHVAGIDAPVLARLATQARLQRATIAGAPPAFELAPPAAGLGLARLPPASPGDVFLDLEGDPFHAGGGLEYLFGLLERRGDGLELVDFWGHDRAGERRAFEATVDRLCVRLEADRGMHVYHYGSYEVAALRRLADRHVTRQEEVDALLRAEVFVDLLAVVKQGLRVGVRSYSLKQIERLYRPARDEAVSTAGASIVEYGRWCDQPDGASWETSEILAQIRAYNRVDCESTAELAAWLRAQAGENGFTGTPPEAIERKPRGPEEALARRILDACADRARDDARVPTLLAHLLGFHRREEKPLWWEYFDRHASTHEVLAEDAGCLGALTRTEAPATSSKSARVYAYRFNPERETKLSAGDVCELAQLRWRVTIESLDAAAGLAHLRLQARLGEPPAELSLIPGVSDFSGKLKQAIYKTVDAYAQTDALSPALEDLIHRRPPKLRGRERGAPVLTSREAPTLDEAIDALCRLEGTTIAVQGPPGTGKTYLAARAIARRLGQGGRVGVSSSSHKAIEKLMAEVLAVTEREGLTVRAAKVHPEGDRGALPETVRCGPLKEIWAEGAEAPNLIGGTAWAMSDPALGGALDDLFIDEAGQVSLANVVAMSGAARNLVLVGDQAQLGQPLRGTHPDGSGTSALEYLLEGRATIPEAMGLFLPRSFRLHPALCRFISDAFYEGRLTPARHTECRVVRVPPDATRVRVEAGLVYVPVAHEGNVCGCDEEVEVVAELVRELLGRERTREDGQACGRVGPEDILIVAPYNVQVRKLQAALPGLRVGTVDRFQGQEAPIVIVSMTASSTEGSARGAEFLLSPNRLNVALSRAQSLAIVVASPELARGRPRTVEEMQLASVFHRMLEHASETR